MDNALFERELRPFIPPGPEGEKLSGVAAMALVAERLKGRCKVWMMPGGGFAAHMAAQLRTQGIEVLGFMDNFKKEGETMISGTAVSRPDDLATSDFDRVLIATPSLIAQEDMRNQLTAILPERHADFLTLLDLFPETLDHLLATVRKNLLTTGLEHFPPEKRICVTTSFLHHNYLKLLQHLKEAGFHISLILNHEFINSALSIHRFRNQGFFDYCLVTPLYDVILTKIISLIDPGLVHAIVTTASARPIAQLIGSNQWPVVVDYCDFKEILFDRDADYLETMSALQLTKEKQAWRIIFTENDGLLYKDSPEIIDHLRKKYDTGPRHAIQFMAYPCLKNFIERPPHQKPAERPLRIVYAGAVINTPNSHPYAHHRSLLDIARALNDQGIAFTIINALDPSGKGYEEYMQLARELPLFEYRFVIPQNRLTQALAEHDIGWFVFDLTHACEGAFFLKTTLGSKIFNYMEAGLPIMVPRETEYLCHWVESRGIGAGLWGADLRHFKEQLNRLDLESMRRNIRRLLPALSMDRQMIRLLDFYAQIMADDSSRLRNPGKPVLWTESAHETFVETNRHNPLTSY